MQESQSKKPFIRVVTREAALRILDSGFYVDLPDDLNIELGEEPNNLKVRSSDIDPLALVK